MEIGVLSLKKALQNQIIATKILNFEPEITQKIEVRTSQYKYCIWFQSLANDDSKCNMIYYFNQSASTVLLIQKIVILKSQLK